MVSLHTSLTFQTTLNFKGAITEYKGILHCEGFDYEQDPEDITNPLPDPFFYKENETGN